MGDSYRAQLQIDEKSLPKSILILLEYFLKYKSSSVCYTQYMYMYIYKL